MQNEGDLSCSKICDQYMERSSHFKDEFCNDDKVKVLVEKLPSHAKNLIEERGFEVNTQPIYYPVETWRGTLLAQEEEIIRNFLLSL